MVKGTVLLALIILATNAQPSDVGLWCTKTDPVTGLCTECYVTDTVLVEGKCICPERTYWTPNICVPVSPLCGQYDYFTGWCTSCKDSSKVVDSEGNCVEGTTTCTSRQYEKNGVCFDVSPECDGFVPSNGWCTSCKDALKVVVAGVCISCGPRQYVNGNICQDVWEWCDGFDPSNGWCTSCIHPEHVILFWDCFPCWSREYKDGNFCRAVSDLCDQYDYFTGRCLSCKDTSATPDSVGRCPDGTTTCTSRQYEINGICHDVSPDCNTFDSSNGWCTSCTDQSKIIDNGVCTSCGSRQYKSGNYCIFVSTDCDTFDSLTGLCLTCLKSTQIVIFGLCRDAPICNPDQYITVQGLCKNVPTHCSDFDTTAQVCKTCEQYYRLDNFGNCFKPICKIFQDLDKNGNCVFQRPVVIMDCLWGYVRNLTTLLCAPLHCLDDLVMAQDGKSCIAMPPFCLDYNSKEGACSNCISGYTLVETQCQKLNCEWGTTYDPLKDKCVAVSCPQGQVLTADGQHCFIMPPFCIEYNSYLSRCERCSQTHILINYDCHLASEVRALENCAYSNVVQGICYECLGGWLKDGFGFCTIKEKQKSESFYDFNSYQSQQIQIQCNNDESVVQGTCVQNPPHCLILDQTFGICAQCQAHYEPQGYQCVFSNNCRPDQIVSEGGKCLDVVINCEHFDEQTGKCTACLNGSPPVNNVCCPPGLVYLGGRCTVQPSSIRTNIENLKPGQLIPTCLSYHPTRGYCLQCSEGSSMNPIDPTTCI